jgi:predicted transcriptional regulator
MMLQITEWRIMMPATNIRLPEDLLKTLRHRAIEEKKSMNQLIREAIEMSLAAVPQLEEHQKDSFEDVIGIAKSGIKDASSKHDRYLYRRKR